MKSIDWNMILNPMFRARFAGKAIALTVMVLFLSACFSPLQVEDGGAISFQIPNEIGAQQWPFYEGEVDRALVFIFRESDLDIEGEGDEPNEDIEPVLIGGLPYHEASVGSDGVIRVSGITAGSGYVLLVYLFDPDYGDEEPVTFGWSMDIAAYQMEEFILVPFNVIRGQTTSGIKVGVLPSVFQ
ncbi:MAG: hypothetical protein EA404_01435 [Spirochaetaceae bacterium]|nr:MAG: hypothetical protein EA404_01435 [Spirochaetaceae bacterium]